MSFSAGARLVRLQPTLLHPRTPSVSAIAHCLSLRSKQIHTNSRAASMCLSYSNNTLKSQFRSASTSSSAQTKSSDSPTPSEADPFSDTLNPPASTRPPPLDLPVRDEKTNLFTHLFRLGKAYTTFYKTGLKAVFTNRRTSTISIAATPPTSPTSALFPSLDKSANPTRASLLLRARVRHDTARLPLFALIVLICGEFTPLIVLLFPRLTPYTCRIPTQMTVIRKSTESRRAASFRALSHARNNGDDSAALQRVADGHICRSLGLGSALWDKMGLDVPFAKSRADGALKHIVQDDAFLRNGGGVSALVDDEVVLACEARGIDTLGKDIASLRDRLEAWVAKSAPSQKEDVEAVWKESTDKARRLLLGLD
ncbi:hypothetical protein HD806DRAFT_525822 [Xylariaceae sp. AK1471]|nr:hypothetical protein HD806DRAFT_525822 [Xylariaceae sp. AK1471]